MKITAKQYAQALFDSIQDVKPSDINTVLDHFVAVLAESNHLHLFEEITDEFHQLELTAKGIKQAEVTSAHPLSRENERMILEQLNKIVKAGIEFKKQIDESLLGGVVVRIDDKLIDASIKNELNQLKNELTL